MCLSFYRDACAELTEEEKQNKRNVTATPMRAPSGRSGTYNVISDADACPRVGIRKKKRGPPPIARGSGSKLGRVSCCISTLPRAVARAGSQRGMAWVEIVKAVVREALELEAQMGNSLARRADAERR